MLTPPSQATWSEQQQKPAAGTGNTTGDSSAFVRQRQFFFSLPSPSEVSADGRVVAVVLEAWPACRV